MTRTERTLCVVYGLIALVALVGTQWVLVDYVAASGGVGDFLDATIDNHAATFLTVDLLAVAFAAAIFMAVDGRRNRVPYLPAYLALVFLVAVSVAFPLYLIARTRTLASAG